MSRVAITLRIVCALVLLAAIAVQPPCAFASTLPSPVAAGVAERALEVTSEASTLATSTITLTAPSSCLVGQSVRATALLLGASGEPLAGRQVVIGQAVPPLKRDRWRYTTGLTDANGAFGITLAPRTHTVLFARFGGDAASAGSRSSRISIRTRIKLAKPWTHDAIAYPGQLLPARGTVGPSHVSSSRGTTLLCERYESGKWVVRRTFGLRIVNTSSGPQYRGTFRLPYSGSWRVKAVHEDAEHARSVGSPTSIKVTDWRKRYWGHRTHGFATSKKLVAITIDDGPNHRTTEICDILERYGAKGTFFFTGHLLRRGYGAQARTVYLRGHEIANHTEHHDMLNGPYATDLRNVTTPKTYIKQQVGFPPIWVRAMGGGVNSTGLHAVRDSGQLYLQWSIDSYDSHQLYTDPGVLYHNVVDHVRPGDVILIHQTHPETIRALPSICRELRRRGYQMVTVSELAARTKPR